MSRRVLVLVSLIFLLAIFTVPISFAQDSGPQAGLPDLQKPAGPLSGELQALAAEAALAQAQAPGQPFQPGNDLLMMNEAGTSVIVQVTARDVNRLLPELTALGFKTLGSRPALHLVEGYLPAHRLRALDRLTRQGLLGVVAVPRPATGTGSVTSQGDFVHEADRVRDSNPSYDGSGVNVGILSDAYDTLGGAAAGVTSGDLPVVNVLLEGPGGSIDEGRAMAELVHDVAPGAGIAFASAFFGQAAFGDSIRDLADPTLGNCRIITDDIFYFDEPMYQDGVIAQAIDEVVTNRNVAYFALAGNLERQAYESTNFNPSPDPSFAGDYHDFDPGAGVDTRQSITIPGGGTIIITLQWDDPFFTTSGVDTDLDIRLYNGGTNNVVAGSVDNNIFSQIPNERFSYTNPSGSPQLFDIQIHLFAGPAPGRIKYVNYGRNNSPPITFNEYGTNSPTLIPHGAATHGRGVGAVNYFDQSNPTDFTSAGPNTILFQPDGTPQAPQVRQTPDFAAIQGTDTTFFGSDFEGNGFPNFFGTSAAAPHAAAIGALVLSANPGFTADQIYTALESAAIDIHSLGFDNRTGLGLINAYDAVFGSVVPQGLILGHDFESGVLAQAWETNTNGAGRIQVTGSFTPTTGSFHTVLGSSLNGANSLNEMVLHFIGTGRTNVNLSFDQREYSDDDDPMPAAFSGSGNYDGVALSVDGSNWHRLESLTGITSTNTYQPFNFDLSAFASGKGLTLGSDVRIKFQQYDNETLTNDGMAFDNIMITADNNAPTAGTPIPTQQARIAAPFSFTIPSNAFSDVDVGDTLTYTATLAGGAPLPAWLSLDATSGTFSGTPPSPTGTLSIEVTGTDTGLLSAMTSFDLQITKAKIFAPIIRN